MAKHLLRLRQVKERVGISTAEIYRRMRDGTFPRSIPIGERSVAWDADDIEQWIKERIRLRPHA